MTFFNRVKGMLDNFVSSELANSNGQEEKYTFDQISKFLQIESKKKAELEVIEKKFAENKEQNMKILEKYFYDRTIQPLGDFTERKEKEVGCSSGFEAKHKYRDNSKATFMIKSAFNHTLTEEEKKSLLEQFKLSYCRAIIEITKVWYPNAYSDDQLQKNVNLMWEHRKEQGICYDDLNIADFIREYVAGDIYRLFLHDRTPIIELVTNNDLLGKRFIDDKDKFKEQLREERVKDKLYLRSKFLNKFTTLIDLKKKGEDYQSAIGFEKMLAVEMLLGELDLVNNPGNFGVKEKFWAKVDHGRTFYLNDCSLKYLQDFLTNYKAIQSRYNLKVDILELSKYLDQFSSELVEKKEEIRFLIDRKIANLSNVLNPNIEFKLCYMTSKVISTDERSSQCYQASEVMNTNRIRSQEQQEVFKHSDKGFVSDKGNSLSDYFEHRLNTQVKSMKELAMVLEVIGSTKEKNIENMVNEYISFARGVFVDPLIWIIKTDRKLDNKDPIVWAIENNKEIDGKNPITYAIEHNIQIEGEDAKEWKDNIGDRRIKEKRKKRKEKLHSVTESKQKPLVKDEVPSSTVSTPKKDSENNIKTTAEKVVSPTEVVETSEHIPAAHLCGNYGQKELSALGKTEMTKKLLIFDWDHTITNRSLIGHFQLKGLGDYNLSKEGTITQQDIKEFFEKEGSGIKNEEKLKHVLKNAFEQGIEIGIASFTPYLRVVEYMVKNHLGLTNEQAKNIKIAVNSINTITLCGSNFPRHCAKNIHILYLLKQYKARYGTLPQEVMLVDDNEYNVKHMEEFDMMELSCFKNEIDDLLGVIERDITEIEITAKELKGIKFIGVKVPIKQITKTDTSADDGYLDRVAEWIGIDYKQQIESHLSTTEKVNSHSEAVETPEHIPAAHSSDNHNKTQKKSDNKKQGVRFADNISTIVHYHNNHQPSDLLGKKQDVNYQEETSTVESQSKPNVSANNIPGKDIPPSSRQATPKKSQSKPNIYKNKGFEKEIMIVVGAIIGTIIGATIAYLAGAATLTTIAAIVVFSAVVGALIGYGIAEICEKVSIEKQNDPKMGTLTALGEVHTTELLHDNVATKT